jgi:hypothetical protein
LRLVMNSFDVVAANGTITWSLVSSMGGKHHAGHIT